MITIKASIPCASPPAWAVLERKLIDIMNESVYPYLEKYTRKDGTLIWRDTYPDTRDGADDFYESFYNWPLFYLLGGGDHLLLLAHRQWDAVTRQLTEYGLVHKEYERGYDQFHQSESYIYFYFLCLADPTNPKLIERARRFAGFYLNEDPEAPNYDPEHKIIRAPHNGSGGPRLGFSDHEEDASYGWSAGMRPYGLPFEDVPGIRTYDDLKDPELALRMGQTMQQRMRQGDVANNLFATSLVTNAYLLTGDEKYKAWVLEYVNAWIERARQNGDLIPDNVGLSGKVGEYIDGKWYGGLYGWSWPHGFYNIGYAALVAAQNAYLMTKNPAYLDLPRAQMDKIIGMGKILDLDSLGDMSLYHHYIGLFAALGEDRRLFVVPNRYADSGWFDYQPVPIPQPAGLWNISMSDEDWTRIEQIRQKSGYDWRKVTPFRDKGDQGHEEPWLAYLMGENPTYPETMLAGTYGQVCRRLELIRVDQADLTQVNIHHWQQLNPVITEALVQLTLGAPQVIYYGGMLISRLRYFDADRQRPGLPQDVAALVEQLEADRVVVRLVNLSPFHARNVIIQAGGLGEHRFTSAAYQERISEYPGDLNRYAAPKLQTKTREVAINDCYLRVHMPPAMEISLDLKVERFANPPSYTTMPKF
jgi:hypothetical protein